MNKITRILLVTSWLLPGAFLPCALVAQTRLWLPSTGAAAVSPAYSAGWDDIPGTADRLALATTSGGTTAHTVLSSVDGNTTTDTDQLARQYVSPPFNGAQTLDGTVKGQIKVQESNAGQNAAPQMTVYVVSNDGSIVQGVALDFYTGGNSSEFSSSMVNRKFPRSAISPATLTSVSVQDCDRLVIEYGSRNYSTGSGVTLSYTFGDVGALDLAENETQTASNDAWVEFSATLSFRAEGPCGGGAARRVIVVD